MYQEIPSEKKKPILAASLALSLFWVIFIWNFWDKGIDALGFNASIFLLAIIALFFYTTDEKVAKKKNLLWLVPLIFISASYSLYENPFLKVVNFLVLPLAFAVFASNTLLPKPHRWKTVYLVTLVAERLRFLYKIGKAFRLLGSFIPSSQKPNQQIIMRIIGGLGLFALIALFVVIPLLTSADPMFALQLKKISDWAEKILTFQYFDRIVFFLFFTVLLASVYLSLQRKVAETIADKNGRQHEEKMLDPIITGIVLGGVLLLYLLFLYSQVKYLFIDALPIEFRDTEQLVKQGFWQLFILSILNILFFLGCFRKTNRPVQNILKAFTVASFLLLLSAGRKMFMYVWFYGLSYEKFFASYTVMYIALLFIWLFVKLVSNRPADAMKFIIFSLLWMYGILTIMPVERLIFSANAALVQRPGSRINMNELRMLSGDALPLVVNYRADDEWLERWCPWYNAELKSRDHKQWYEKSLSSLTRIEKSPNKIAFEGCREKQRIKEEARQLQQREEQQRREEENLRKQKEEQLKKQQTQPAPRQTPSQPAR